MNKLNETSSNGASNTYPILQNLGSYAKTVVDVAISFFLLISEGNRGQSTKETDAKKQSDLKILDRESQINQFKMSMYQGTIEFLERSLSEDCKNAELFYLNLGIIGMIDNIAKSNEIKSKKFTCLKEIQADLNPLFDLHYAHDTKALNAGVRDCLNKYKGLLAQAKENQKMINYAYTYLT